MRDLDFLRDKPPLPSLVIYRYRSEPLRRAVFAYIRQALIGRGQELVGSTPERLWKRLNGGGLFEEDATALFIDWSLFSERLSVGSIGDGVGDSDPVGAEDMNDLDLRSVLRIARLRPTHSPTAAIFVHSSDGDGAATMATDAAAELFIEGTESISRQDFPLLVAALAPGLPSGDVAELGRRAGDEWQRGTSFASLCEKLETAGVCAKVQLREAPGLFSGTGKAAAHLPTQVLRNIVFGSQSARLQLVTSLSSPHGSAIDALRALFLVTLRLMPAGSDGPTDRNLSVDEDVVRWINWLLVLLRNSEALGASGAPVPSLWPSPDRRAQVMLQMLEEHQTTRDQGDSAWQKRLDLVEGGARWLHVHDGELCKRTRDGLRQLTSSENWGGVDGHETHRGRIFQALDQWLAGEKPVRRSSTDQNSAPVRFTALSQLDGQVTLKSVFLRYFDDRKTDARAFPRPLLLVGRDWVGVQATASLLSRLFVCETATAISPIQCGSCEGCLNAEAQVAELDAGDLSALLVDAYLSDKIRMRGTLWGSPVTLVHNVDRLSMDQTEKLLKSVEASFGTGLRIFTGRDATLVQLALRSRCMVLHLWQPRGEQRRHGEAHDG